jgi:hypothetical protein
MAEPVLEPNEPNEPSEKREKPENSRDAYHRACAWDDYRALPDDQRSPGVLWRHYVEANRRHEPVPTTNRTTVFLWAREDRWDQRILTEELERQTLLKEAQAADRSRQYKRMSMMLDNANEQLVRLINQDKTPPNVRLRAITDLYDRLGFVPISRSTAAQKEVDEANAASAPLPLAPDRPAEDAPDEDWVEYSRILPNCSNAPSAAPRCGIRSCASAVMPATGRRPAISGSTSLPMAPIRVRRMALANPNCPSSCSTTRWGCCSGSTTPSPPAKICGC